jgi:hypothetical protein
VFKLKCNEDGQVVKHKAHLVVKGYVQKEGIDFSEVFALVARLELVRLLLVIAAHLSWEVHHMDVESAFLNGELKEVMYVQQPPRFIDENNPGKVLRLHRALYGLRQAPRAWNAKLDSTLLSLGFKRCISQHGIYTRGNTERWLIMGVHVNDLIITGFNVQVLSSFKKEMCKSFKMNDLGTLSYYRSGMICFLSRAIHQEHPWSRDFNSAKMETYQQWTPPITVASSAVCATW